MKQNVNIAIVGLGQIGNFLFNEQESNDKNINKNTSFTLIP